MKIGEIKTVMTFVGMVQIHKVSAKCYKAETTRGHHMAKRENPQAALKSLLEGVASSLIAETINCTDV